ncbi:MAG: hypothetical protein GX846_08475 [Deltaproteobacteria bacterium]|nr:hypothetical protein [Deltaproteobacteria bacterium]
MTFITCSRKRSMPKVSTAICKKCPRLKKCPDYHLFEQPLLFPDLKKSDTSLKKRKKRGVLPASKGLSCEIQLRMHFMKEK